MRRLVVVFAAAALLCAGGASGAGARARLNFATIEQQYMCVTCNLPLPEAESAQATRERQFIRGLINQGDDAETIRRHMIDLYGERVLQLPPAKGITWFGYAIPIVAVIVLVVALIAILPRWRRRSPAIAGAAGPAIDDEENRRLDADLALHDR